jgi:sterol desaturase/sphingolipid hydroxylase (fatty acid hydroxylase superfamily)
VLNPVTQYRIHPVELVLNNVGKTLVFGFVTGLFDYLSDYHIHPFTFLGANVFSFLFLIWGSNLRHSHVRLTYFNWLEYILISPFQHQIHHSNSRKQFNKNMGSKLAVWDWLFGTLMRSNQVTELSIGLGEEDKDYNNFSKNLWMPFWKIFRNK